MKVYNVLPAELTVNSNKSKELFIQKMVKEKIITNEQGNEMLKYSIIVHEKGFFGKLVDDILGYDDELNMTVVKVIE